MCHPLRTSTMVHCDTIQFHVYKNFSWNTRVNGFRICLLRVRFSFAALSSIASVIGSISFEKTTTTRIQRRKGH